MKTQFFRLVRLSLPSVVAIAMLALSDDSANAVQLLDPPSQRIDAVSSAPIRTLLTDDWKRGPGNAAKSEKTFEAANSRDELMLVAYAINRIQQNKTREAKSIAEEITTNFAGNLDGWMLKTWLNTLDNNYDVALVSMRAFKKQIDDTNDLPDATRIQIYKRLGRLLGYLQGPVKDRVNNDLLDGTIALVTQGVAPDALKAFSDSRDEVLKAYDELVSSQADKTQVELSKVEAENEQERISLEKQNQMLSQSESQLIPQKQQIQIEADRQISNLNQQGSSIQQQLNRISADINTSQLNLQYMYADLDIILQQQQQGYQVSTYAIRNQIRNAEYGIATFRNNGNQLANQLRGIQNQIAQTNYGARQQLKRLDQELKKLNGSKRRNDSKLAKIAAGPEIADGKLSAMKNRVVSLQTYDDLPTELYRQQLLDHLTN